eukprot:UN14228
MRAVARAAKAPNNMTKKIGEKFKFYIVCTCKEYQYFLSFFINHNGSQ